jgi:hypothetical protein
VKIPVAIGSNPVRLDEAETSLVHMDGLVYWNLGKRHVVTEEEGLGESIWLYVLEEIETEKSRNMLGSTLVKRAYHIIDEKV